MTNLAKNLEKEARNCQELILWLDCDRVKNKIKKLKQIYKIK